MSRLRRVLAPLYLLIASPACSQKPPGGSTDGSVSKSQAAPAAPAQSEAPKSPLAPADAVPAAAPKPPPGPLEVAKEYLMLGSLGDLSKIKHLVDPACYDTKVGQVDATMMMGVRLKLESAEPTITEETPERVTLQTNVKGSAHVDGEVRETDIHGKPVTRQQTATLDGASLSETLRLRKLDGRWIVTCDEAARP